MARIARGQSEREGLQREWSNAHRSHLGFFSGSVAILLLIGRKSRGEEEEEKDVVIRGEEKSL